MNNPIEATLSSAITASVTYTKASPRCWWCKIQAKRPERNRIPFSCSLFPTRTMCSFECARAYILHAVQVCDTERHELLLQLADAQFSAPVVPSIEGIKSPAAPWWRNPDLFCAEYCHSCSFEAGHNSGARRRGECMCRRLCAPNTDRTLAYVIDAATDWPWAAHGHHAPTRIHCHGCFRPCDMNKPTFFALLHPITGTDHIPQCHRRFCSARCLRAGLEETQISPVVRALLIHDSLQVMATWHGLDRDDYLQHETQCDWRLRQDFGGCLSPADWDACTARFIITHPTMGGGVDPKTNTATIVRVTTQIAIIPQAPHDTSFEDDHAAFVHWVKESCAIHESVSTSLADSADLESAPQTVRNFLLRFPGDSPIVKFWLANRAHPKAQNLTLFRKRDLPNTSRTVHMVNTSIDDLFA